MRGTNSTQVTTPYGEHIKAVLFPDEQNMFLMHMSWDTDSGPFHYSLQLTKAFTLSVQTKIEDQVVSRLAEQGVIQTMLWLEDPLDLLDEVRFIDRKKMC